MHLLVTRPRNDTDELVSALEQNGHMVTREPLLDIVFSKTEFEPETSFQAVLITSANSARALARQTAMQNLAHTPAITVGPASRKAARQAGFETAIAVTPGDVSGLIAHIRHHLNPQDGPLLYASGAVTTGDLQTSLHSHGFDVHREILYRAEPVSKLSDHTLQLLQTGQIEGVLLFSPRTAKIWLAVLAQVKGGCDLSQVKHFCLSQNVANVIAWGLENNGDIIVCDSPDTNSMLDAVKLSC